LLQFGFRSCFSLKCALNFLCDYKNFNFFFNCSLRNFHQHSISGDCSVEKSYEKCLTELIESGEICCCDSPDCNEIIVYDYVIAEDDQVNNNDTEQLSTNDPDEWQRDFSSVPTISVENVSEEKIFLRRDVSNMESSSNGEGSSDSAVLTSSPTSTSPNMEYSEAEETALEGISEPVFENSPALFSEASPLAPDAAAEPVNYSLEVEIVETILTIPAAQSAPVGELETSTESQLFEESSPVTEPSSIAAPQAITGSSQPEAGPFSLEEPFSLLEPEAVAEGTSTEGPNSLQPESTTEVLQSQEQLYLSVEVVSETKPEPSSTNCDSAMIETEPLAETAPANDAELTSTFQPDSPSGAPLPMEPEAELASEQSSTAETELSSSFLSSEKSESSTEPMTTEENETPSDESSVDIPSTVEPQLSSMVTSPMTESSAERALPLIAATEALTNQHIEVSQASETPQEPEGNSADSNNVLVSLCIVFFTALLNSAHNHC
uniref:VWFC domain-containing protein n=1 Tax=Ascaris lumbricoides TaxID=6252 RepID=A0A0M3HGS8_ASCLU